MEQLLQCVPADFHDRFKAIVSLTDCFCDAHLNGEYKELCRKMAVAVCRKGSPVVTGKAEGWASGIVHALGWVNFLHDSSQNPHMTSAELAKGFGVSQGTMAAKSKVLRDGLDLMPFHPTWSLPSKINDNPLAWMVELSNGMLIDARHAPRHIQEEAFRKGLIPSMPPTSLEIP
jgi:hypothetical protein